MKMMTATQDELLPGDVLIGWSQEGLTVGRAGADRFDLQVPDELFAVLSLQMSPDLVVAIDRPEHRADRTVDGDSLAPGPGPAGRHRA